MDLIDDFLERILLNDINYHGALEISKAQTSDIGIQTDDCSRIIGKLEDTINQ